MYPCLQSGCKVKIVPVDAARAPLGDIVIFGKDILKCHRIIGKMKFFGNYYFIQKGDNSCRGGMVKFEDLVVKVEEVFNEEGKRVNKLDWHGRVRLRHNVILYYLYLFMYLIKHHIWHNNINKFTCFVGRFYWKYI